MNTKAQFIVVLASLLSNFLREALKLKSLTALKSDIARTFY